MNLEDGPTQDSASTDATVRSLQAELESARSELARVRQVNELHSRHPHRRLRNASSAVLIALVSIVSAVGLIAVWLSTTLLETDRYVSTVSPLASDPQVQAVVADRVADQLFAQMDVTSTIAAALPPNAQSLAPPLAAQVRGFVEDQVRNVMATDGFRSIWDQANRTAHAQFSALLLEKDGDEKILQASNGTVSIDLQALAQQVLQGLEQRGLTLFQNIPIDRVTGQVELIQSQDLRDASTAAKFLHTARYVAPVLFVLLIASGLYLATDRRRAIIGLGAALLVGMVLVSAALAVGRQAALDQARSLDLPPGATAAAYDTITRFLQRSSQVGYALVAIAVFGAVFTGDGRAALALKRAVTSFSRRAATLLDDQGWRPHGASDWVAAHVGVVRAVVVVVAITTLVWWSSPTVTVVLWLTVSTLVVLLAFEVLRWFSIDHRDTGPAQRVS